MSIEFTDWLNNSSVQGCLLLFSPILNRWHVASFLVNQWDHYSVVVVTDHPEEFNNSLKTNENRAVYELITYSDLDQINFSLTNFQTDLILFDDARMLSIILPALNYPSSEISGSLFETTQLLNYSPKIIVLTTWGDTPQQLSHINQIFGHINSLSSIYLDILIEHPFVHWEILISQMTSKQSEKYQHFRNLETINNSIIPYPITRMITLYTYPDSVMIDHIDQINQNGICNSFDLISSDKLDTPQSWITERIFDSLNEDSPKLITLIDSIVSQWPNKQVILTRFNQYYGVDLINSILQLLTRKQQNPYGTEEIITISCSDDYSEISKKILYFNQLERGILITNIVPPLSLTNVKNLHVTDSYDFPTLKMFFDRCQKCPILTEKCDNKLNVCLYLTDLPNLIDGVNGEESEVSADRGLYQILVSQINESNQLYQTIVKQSARLIPKSSNCLYLLPPLINF